jgi:competence protein ComEC
VAGDAWGLRVLPATPAGGVDQNQKENDDALVVLAELGGQRVLLPGDAEGQVLEDLDLPPCLVVAAPHHGSGGGIGAGLLAELAPRLAVITVGDNGYGHPDPDQLEVFAAAGVPAVRTDERGDVAVMLGVRGLEVRAARPPA